MNRKEHMEWCKNRALEYVNQGDTSQAWASMVSDLGKHEETKGHMAIDLGMMLALGGSLSSPEKMRDFIQGFN